MNLSGIQTKLAKMSSAIIQRGMDNYTCSRDDNGNLIVQFPDEKIILPSIKFRPYQLEIQKEFINGKRYFFVVWPRRSGKEFLSWNLILQAALEKPGLYVMIYPQATDARRILWDGNISIHSENKTVKFLDMIPRRLILGIEKQSMVIRLVGGAIIKIMGSTDRNKDNHKSTKGFNPIGIVLSEFAYSDPRPYLDMLPIITESKGWVFIQTTFNGVNFAYDYMQKVQLDPKWVCKVESIKTLTDEKGNPYITEEMVNEDRKSGMPEYLIQQEYYSVVALNEDLMYFASHIKNIIDLNRISDSFEALPNKPVYAAYDLGRRDDNVVILFQIEDSGNPYLIHAFKNSGRMLNYYVDYIRGYCAKRGLIVKQHLVPHDGKNETMIGSVMNVGIELGENFQDVKRPINKMVAIEQMRRMLYRCKFNKKECEYLISCLSNYKKEFDEKRNSYKDNPVHDWASHGVDAFQTMTLAFEQGIINIHNYPITYYNKDFNEQHRSINYGTK